MGLALGLAADLGCPWLPAQLPSGSGVRCGAFGVPQWLWQSLGSSPREEPELWGWDHVRLPMAGVMKRAPCTSAWADDDIHGETAWLFQGMLCQGART